MKSFVPVESKLTVCVVVAELQKISNEEALTVTDLKNKKAGVQNPKL